MAADQAPAAAPVVRATAAVATSGGAQAAAPVVRAAAAVATSGGAQAAPSVAAPDPQSAPVRVVVAPAASSPASPPRDQPVAAISRGPAPSGTQVAAGPPAVSPQPAARPAHEPKPAGAPPAVVSPPSSGGIAATPPADANLTTADALARQLEAALAGAPSPVAVPGDQPSGVASLDPALESVIARLQSSLGRNPVSSTLPGPTQPVAGAPEAAGLSTSQAHRGAPAVPTGSQPALAAPSGIDADHSFDTVGQTSSAGWYLGVGADRVGRPDIAPARAQVKAIHRSGRRSSGTVPPPEVVAALEPPPGSLPSGAPAGTASTAGGVGGAALALLAAAAALLLPTLLPGRLTLELFPWQSARLASRLERPG